MTQTPTDADALLAAIDPARLPRHLAIIMDGNGRWARQQGKSRVEGHRAGIESVREAITTCRELGIEVLTLYAFSGENWQRPRLEVRALMRFLKEFLSKELSTLLDNDIRLATIGDSGRLPPAVQETLEDTIKRTSECSSMTLVLALNYGSRQEIAAAARALAADAAAGRINPDQVDEDTLTGRLETARYPDPDLLIRTSGEQRLSNFLLWQAAYAEFVFSPILWPDFRKADLYRSILDYQGRERRFGLTGEQVRPNKEARSA
ncbi:MAG: isoprenyl transferase [Leptospirillia bacterium]